jgi:hypothetical protein
VTQGSIHGGSFVFNKSWKKGRVGHGSPTSHVIAVIEKIQDLTADERK